MGTPWDINLYPGDDAGLLLSRAIHLPVRTGAVCVCLHDAFPIYRRTANLSAALGKIVAVCVTSVEPKEKYTGGKRQQEKFAAGKKEGTVFQYRVSIYCQMATSLHSRLSQPMQRW